MWRSLAELSLEAGHPINVSVANDDDVLHDIDLDVAEVPLDLEVT